MALTLLIGGARSGKSDAAVAMASRWDGPVVFIATGEARDDEMADRIAKHRASRPSAWTTIETDDLAAALAHAPLDSFVVIDCLTLWISRLMERELSDAGIDEVVTQAARAAGSRRAPTVAVTNDVGSGIVPDNAQARRYRNLLGAANKTWARVSERALFVLAGRALALSTIEDITDE
jgi:adenosyl cobinamide kinase/adenosyl cobinamide phosphate guanylyltransferase